jgi:hypothetical protein
MAASRFLPLAWLPGVATWIVVWAILAAATVVIVALMRSRWREVKPWKKCALLSLWVHVLLATLATMVRIGVGGPGFGPGEGGPMEVAVIDVDISALEAIVVEPSRGEPDAAPALEPQPEPIPYSRDAETVRAAAEESQPTEATPPEAAAPVEEPAEEPVAQPTLPTADLALDAPDLLPKPAPEPAPEAPQPEQEPEAKRQAEAAKFTAPATATKVAPTRGAADGEVASAAVAPRRTIPRAYANRFADREAQVAGGGGNPTTERAVRAALAWLAAAQEADGHWNPKRHGAGVERYVLGENRGGAGARADTGITALALLAFLGAGHTHQQGPYADNIARGLDYLRRTQGSNGNLGGDAELFAHMYCHSMAAFAVSEAAAMTGDDKLLPVVRRAVAYSLAVQHPTDGGWRYRPGDRGDTSQLGWQLMALKSAELAGVDVPDVVWTRVDRYLRSVERGAAGGLAAYRPEGPPTRAMTAESLFCRQLLTRRRDGGLPPAATEEARRSLLDETPGGVSINFYYWYYATIALHRAQTLSPAAEEDWDQWNEALATALVGSQDDDGSWPAACVWGGYGGRVYTTALGAMCLEVYYRYAPDEEPGIARHGDWHTVPAR